MFAEDLTAFFDTDDFAVSALWKGSTAVKGIFDNGYSIAEIGIGMSAALPTFKCAAHDVTGMLEGDSLVINSVNYVVTSSPQPDSTGNVVIVELKKS